MDNKEFASFIHGLDELVDTLKPDESISVEIYDYSGREMDDED